MKDKKKWLWEFSKKLVVACSLSYFIVLIVALIGMYISEDFSSLSTLIEQNTHMLEVCVFGYFVKAGLENIFKIRNQEE